MASVVASGVPRPVCKICEAAGAAEIVNKLLDKKTFLRDIARETGFSKSAVHRHSQKCFIKTKAGSLKSAYFDPDRDRVLILYPNGKCFVDHDPHGRAFIYNRDGSPIELQPSDLTPDDVLVIVERERRLPDRTPAEVPPVPEPAKPEIQPVEASKNRLN
jgi:hypothetical protein